MPFTPPPPQISVSISIHCSYGPYVAFFRHSRTSRYVFQLSSPGTHPTQAALHGFDVGAADTLAL